nr:hypothetical protein Iba_chr14aCG6130 [Ipomoea batatas]
MGWGWGGAKAPLPQAVPPPLRPLELHDVRLPGQMLQDHTLPPRVLDILRRHKLPPRNFLAHVFQPVAFSVAIVKQFRGNGISGIGRDPYN